MKDTYYFPHDYNARQDPKLQDVMAHHGVAGIGIYWCLVEMLYEQGGVVPLKAVKGIAYALHVDGEVVSSIINDFDLFQVEGDNITSKSVSVRLQKRLDIIENAKKASNARWSKKSVGNADTMQTHTECNAGALQEDSGGNADVMQIKGKENKENKNKEKINSYDSIEREGVSENPCASGDAPLPLPKPQKKSLEDRKKDFYNSLVPYVAQYGKDMVRDFFECWSEPDRAKNPKMRFEKQKTWSTPHRLATWARKEDGFNPRRTSTSSSGKTTIFEEIARLNNKFQSQAQITES